MWWTNMNKTRELVFVSVLAALGSILGLFEGMIPLPFIAPGVRLGFSNIVVLVSLILFGYKKGILVSLLKSVLLMLMTGNVSSFMYSFSGALFSSISMSIIILIGAKYVSLIGVSLIGSAFHNIAQVTISAIVLSNLMMFSYLPILLILGLFTGFFVGISSDYIVKNLKRTISIKHEEWLL